jgi:mannose-6-phosphate isomerase-like protein (cupin superfamily)
MPNMQPISRSSAEHYTWGAACDGWHLVKRADLSVIAERVPPGAKEARHFHSASRQFFFILSGEAVIEVGGERVSLGEGQGIEIAPGVPHQFMNEAKEDVHFIVVSHPTTRGDRVDV